MASPIKSGRLVTGMVSRWPGSRLGKCRAQPRCPLFVRQVMLRFGRHQAKRVVAPLHPVQHPEGRAAEAGDRLELPLVRVLVPDLGHHAFGLAVRFRPYAIPAHHIKMRRAEHSPARLKNVEKDIITFSSNVCVTKQGGTGLVLLGKQSTGGTFFSPPHRETTSVPFPVNFADREPKRPCMFVFCELKFGAI